MSLSACPHRPPCAGCPRFGVPGIARDARESLRALAYEHGLAGVAEHSGALSGFRHRARLAIRGRQGSPKIGLFEADSHHVVHVPNCGVHHPLINEVAGAVRGALAQTRLTCYSDRAHLGFARHLQVVVERGSGTAQVVLVVNATQASPFTAVLELIRERLGARLHSLWLNFNTQPTNTILGSDFHLHCGADSVVETFGGAAVHYPPGAFGQSNLDVAGQIVAHIRERIPQQAQVTEYYAGVGAIGLSVLGQVSRLKLNELSAQSLRGLALGVAALAPQERDKIEVLPGLAGESLAAAHGSQLVIVDPPRKGLDAELTRYLAAQPPEHLLYVSCGVQSLLHDIQELVAGGAVRLVELTAFNLMPFTEHVETVARFVRIID